MGGAVGAGTVIGTAVVGGAAVVVGAFVVKVEGDVAAVATTVEVDADGACTAGFGDDL
jgi:hypothetical protein